VKYDSIRFEALTLRARIESIICFSKYLDEHHEICSSINYLNRVVILEYVDWLKTSDLAISTISSRLFFLKAFLSTGQMNGWFSIPDGMMTAIPYLKSNKSIPKSIPEDVLVQLNQNLDKLPDPVMRLLLVMQECGMRASELVGLKLHCIHQDSQGDWFIGFNRKKVKAEHRVPISKELVAVIQEQQAYIKEQLPGFDFLFCARRKGGNGPFVPEKRQLNVTTLAINLNSLAAKCNITDESGKLWHFHGHQFRHTVGTKMINNGVPLHIVQRYLGHASPSMTLVYANIHDKTLKTEFLKYRSKVVTVAGDVIKESTSLEGEGELSWMRKNILTQALPNGSCARPIVKGPCPHANACLTCADFRTTAEFLEKHKKQLDDTEKIIVQAKANGWQRQVEMNETVAANLKTMIASLTEDVQDVGA
jgi:integrase/recombinase XerD